MFKDNVRTNETSEMSLEDKYTFFLILRKFLRSKDVEDALLGQEKFENLREKYGNLIYTLAYLERGDFVKGPREEIIVHMKCPTENPETFKTVACLDVLRESSSDNGHCRIADNAFEDLKDIVQNGISVSDAIELTHAEIKVIQNNNEM